MKATIVAAGLSVADLVEKRDVVERYQQALARRTNAGAPAAAAQDPVAAAARAAAVPVRPSNPRPMRGSVTTPTRPADDGADARHELTEEQESVCAAAMNHAEKKGRSDIELEDLKAVSESFMKSAK